MPVPFLESPRFPDNIAYWSRGGPTWSTAIATTASGFEQRNVNWSQARGRYGISQGLAKQSDIAMLISFFRAVRGQAYGFRLKDYADFQCSQDEGEMLQVALGVYQLQKTYAIGELVDVRKISKPVIGTVQVYQAGALVAPAAVDYTTGRVTLAPKKTATITSITNAAVTTVTTQDPHGFEDTDVVAIGAAEYQVTVVDPSTFTIPLDSTLSYVSLSSKAAQVFRSAGDSFAAACEFDVPVRFDSDIFDGGFDTGLYSLGNVQLIELLIPDK